ncbi:MAG: NAD(P)H-dependent oxidoreductase [Acidobacteriota bacterium]
MKVLAFAASSSRRSINKQLVTAAGHLLQQELAPSAQLEVLDLNDYEMPLYSVDREQQSGVPQEANRFLEKIAGADALLISYAEHNGSYTAAWKSHFDWMSRVEKKVFQGKSMVILSTSPGPGGARSVLASAENSAPFFGAEIRGTFSLPKFGENFDTDAQTVSNDEKREELLQALKALVEAS